MYRLKFLADWLFEVSDVIAWGFAITNVFNPVWWLIVWGVDRILHNPSLDERVAELVRKRLDQRKLSTILQTLNELERVNRA